MADHYLRNSYAYVNPSLLQPRLLLFLRRLSAPYSSGPRRVFAGLPLSPAMNCAFKSVGYISEQFNSFIKILF